MKSTSANWLLRLAILVGVAAVAGLLVGRPGTVTRRLEAIRAAGLPAVWEEVEAMYPQVASGENGAPALLEALGGLRFDTRTVLPGRDEPWTDANRSWAADQAERNAQAAAALHEALRARQWRFQMNFGSVTNLALSHLSDHKQGAQWLRFEAIHAAVGNDPDGAVRAVHDILVLARTLDGEPFFLSQLVRVAELAVAVSALEQVLSRTTFDDRQLAGVQAAFSGAIGTNTLFRALAGERAYGSSLFALPSGYSMPSIAGWPRTSLGAAGSWLYAGSGLQTADHRFYLDRMGDLLEAAAMPPGPEMRTAMVTFDQKMGGNRIQVTRILSRMILPGLSKILAKELRSVATIRCAMAGLALERFHLAHGRLPDSLDELVPRFLGAVPADPMDGRPLRYRRLDRGHVVYSVGDDLTDDGGVEFADRPKNSSVGWDYTFVVRRAHPAGTP